MRNSAKGVLAAGAAVALLVGGGGTLAFWNDIETFGAGRINSGSLSLGEVACGSWMYDAEGGGGAFDATDVIVPGDTLTRTCVSAIVAEGDHLEADISVTGGSLSAGTSGADLLAEATLNLDVTKTSTGNVTSPLGPSISSSDDGSTLTAVLTLEFPYGVLDNGSMSQGLDIDAVTITATQAEHPTPAP